MRLKTTGSIVSDITHLPPIVLKARTHTPILVGSVLESALESTDSSCESADSNADARVARRLCRVGQLSVLNMFNI